MALLLSVTVKMRALKPKFISQGLSPLIWDIAASTLSPCAHKKAASGGMFELDFFHAFFVSVFMKNHLHLSLTCEVKQLFLCP